jgi:plastocyanin
MKKLGVFIAVFALLAGACGDDDDDGGAAAETTSSTEASAAADGPLTYNVTVDAPSPEGKNISLGTYFPGAVKIHPGDKVVFENQSTQAPHTISFGINSDRSNSPVPFTKALAFNPAVFGPCMTSTDPTPDLEACPEPPATPPPAYQGKGYWNSGALVPGNAPEGPKEITVEFSEAVPPGNYNYACILHGPMGGRITVVAPDETRDEPDKVTAAAEKAAADVMAKTEAAPDPTPAAGNVEAGADVLPATKNRFFPEVIEIKAGETVTWKSVSVVDPHTITLAPPFQNPEDPRGIPPTGVADGGSYTEGFTNSGVLGPKPFPAETFSLRFPKAGSYPYICALHPGMVGTVNVT